MFQWNDGMRPILKDCNDEEKEKSCREMINFGYDFLVKYKGYDKPRSWSYSLVYFEEIENYIMEKSMPGSYDSKMVKISADHACFIADYGWEKYENEMQKPQDIDSVEQFFYDKTFDDYDPKDVKIEDPFKREENQAGNVVINLNDLNALLNAARMPDPE